MVNVFSEDDYLSSGSVKTPQILSQGAPAIKAPPKNKKDDLYLEGYGRQFGEKMTYSIGLTYGLGLGFGGGYGFLLGCKKGGATPKLFLNSVMNSCGSNGPYLANQGAIMTMFYVCSNQLVGLVRGEDDMFNAPIGGGIAGALYKSTTRSWTQVGKYSAAACVAFTGIDQVLRRGIL